MTRTCNLPELKACCCTCQFHVRDYHHCTTAWDIRLALEAAIPEFKGCVCNIPKGWVCMPPESKRVHSGWPEHGLCELWIPTNYSEAAT